MRIPLDDWDKSLVVLRREFGNASYAHCRQEPGEQWVTRREPGNQRIEDFLEVSATSYAGAVPKRGGNFE